MRPIRLAVKRQGLPGGKDCDPREKKRSRWTVVTADSSQGGVAPARAATRPIGRVSAGTTPIFAA
jgi:hypothetical protein